MQMYSDTDKKSRLWLKYITEFWNKIAKKYFLINFPGFHGQNMCSVLQSSLVSQMDFSKGFLANILQAFFIYHFLAKSPPHRSLIHITTLILL